MITLRAAIALDTSSIAQLLNEIIAEGGTTALTRPVTGQDLTEWMRFAPGQSAWHVALDEAEAVQGVQWVEPHRDLPPDACDIATFVRLGRSGLGIGSALFAATRAAAVELGYRWINATIRADNEGGLIYYQSRGFRDYGTLENQSLAHGETVTKILKRFDLD